jgi:nucleotide-binding universal stress UspA family protein
MSRPMVVGVDGTADSLAALSAAADLASEAGSRLIVVHVRHENGVVVANCALAGVGAAVNEALDEVEEMSGERAADVLAGRRAAWRLEVSSGDPATELIAAARRHEASTIVVGGRTHGVVGGLVTGSVAQKLVRHSPVSVLIVRDGRAHRLEIGPGAVLRHGDGG